MKFHFLINFSLVWICMYTKSKQNHYYKKQLKWCPLICGMNTSETNVIKLVLNGLYKYSGSKQAAFVVVFMMWKDV